MASLLGLLYQIQIIYNQFMSGKTIINLKIGRFLSEAPPAVTICIPGLFSMERAAKFNPIFASKNKIYIELLKNHNFSKAREFFIESFWNYSSENLNNNGLDVNEIIDNISLKYMGNDEGQVILFDFLKSGEINVGKGQLILAIYKSKRYELFIIIPLETIVIRQVDKNYKSREETKCLTFLSHAQNEWRNFQTHLEGIRIQTEHQ